MVKTWENVYPKWTITFYLEQPRSVLSDVRSVRSISESGTAQHGRTCQLYAIDVIISVTSSACNRCALVNHNKAFKLQVHILQ